MRVSHAMLLNVIAREGNPLEAMRRLLRDNHEDGRAQVRLVRRAVAQHRALLAAGVVVPVDPPDADGRTVRLVDDLQLGFALNQPLSTFALGVFDVLDPEEPTYALDVVSVIEATLDDPRTVLGAQEHKARGEAIGEMKAEGIEYDERMELLEEVSWPKPLEELLTHTYEVYRRSHPWVSEDALSPKSVVRDMYERAMTFAEYVAFYGLTRSEGLVLRYLGDAYRALRQTVPDSVRSYELDDIELWLGAIVRQTDSSLLDEWESLTSPGVPERGTVVSRPAGAPHRQRSRLHRAGPQRDVPPCRVGRAAPYRRADGVVLLVRGGVGRGAGGVLRRPRLDRHRPGRTGPTDVAAREGTARVGGAADPRRPGR